MWPKLLTCAFHFLRPDAQVFNMRYLVRHAQPIGIRNYLQIRSDVGQVGIYIRSVSSQSQITIKLNASIENRARLVYAAVQIKSATRTRSQVSHCASKVAYFS